MSGGPYGPGGVLSDFGGGSPRCILGETQHFMFPRDIWVLCGKSLRGVGGYLSGINGNWRRLNKFGGQMGSQSLQYRVKTLFWHSPEWYGFLTTNQNETSKYQNRCI